MKINNEIMKHNRVKQPKKILYPMDCEERLIIQEIRNYKVFGIYGSFLAHIERRYGPLFIEDIGPNGERIIIPKK